MSECLELNVTKIVNEDGSATFTLTTCPICHKCLEHVTPNIEQWIYDIIECRASHEGDKVYKNELDRHLKEGTLSSDMTKGDLILNSSIHRVLTEDV